MNQADDHHVDRLDFHERALMTKSAGLTGNLTGVQLTNDGPGKSSVVIYLQDNGRSAPLDDDRRANRAKFDWLTS